MPVLGTEALTLADLAKRQDADKRIDSQIIEMRSEVNEWIKDAKWMVCNNGDMHKTTVRKTLPPATWRVINRGVHPGKSVTEQVDEKTGQISAISQVDNTLLDLSDDQMAFLLSEERAQTESLDQELSRTFFYGTLGSEPAAFNGLFSRYNELNGLNVFNMGGTGATNTSLGLVTWGDMTCHMLYPRGTAAGIKRKFKADETLFDKDNAQFLGCKTFYEWHAGMALRDQRTCARIANIDVSKLDDLIAQGAEDPISRKLVRMMTIAHNAVFRHKGSGRMVWYANQTIFNMLHLMAVDKMNVSIGIKEFEGVPVTTFLGVPIRMCDQLLDTEEAVA